MTIRERIALARAGYSKKEIEKLAQDEANEPKQEEPKQEEPKQEEPAEPKQEEAKQIADSFTNPAQAETVPAWAKSLLDSFTANQILMSNQPPEENVDTVCAKIIEPIKSFDPNK